MLNISYTNIDGKYVVIILRTNYVIHVRVPPKLRQVNVDYFNRASADPRVSHSHFLVSNLIL